MNSLFDIVDAYREDLLREFGEAVPGIQQAFEQIPDPLLHRPLGPGAWSPHQEMAYLRDIEKDLFWPCLQVMLTEREPQLESAFPLDRADWSEGYSAEEPLDRIVAEWAGLRRRELERVKDLPREAWNRTGRHPRWGVRTVQWWVEHSLAYSRELLKRLDTRYNLTH